MMGEVRPMKVVFLCHGNICRSPMAQFIFSHIISERGLSESFDISSAAVSYEETGNPMYPPARKTLRSHGIPFGEHHAHRITEEEFRDADIVLVMDSSNERILRRIVGDADFSKVHRMMEYAGSSRDVADPWYTGDFEKTYDDLTLSCTSLADVLSGKVDGSGRKRKN